MKKGKLIALTLALSLTIMGVGYAAWQDNVTIHSEVTTGNLDVQFADLESFSNKDLPILGTPNKAEIISNGDSYIDLNDVGTISKDKKVLTIDAGDFYPANSEDLFMSMSVNSGGSYTPPYQNTTELPALCFNGVIQNLGSIPVKFNGIEIEYEGDKEVYDNIRAEFGYVYKLASDNSKILKFQNGEFRKLKPDSPGETPRPPFDMPLASLKSHLEKQMSNVILYPNEILVAGNYSNKASKIVPKIQFYIYKQAKDSLENKDCTIKIKFKWKQFNQ